MTRPAEIKRARERVAKAVTLRPAVGQSTSTTRARVIDGATCEITEGAWKLIADMPKSMAGAERGPTPGVLGRGALASCCAITIVGWAADLGVPLNGVEVEVQADWDARGDLGLAPDVVPGYSQVRVVVSIDSPAPDADLQELLRRAERFTPYIDVFRRANDVVFEPRITRRAAE